MDWGLLIQALGRLGICESFIQMTKFLFVDAHAMVNINRQSSNHFLIRRGVMLGCPLAPYIFLLVVEVLSHMIKQCVQLAI